jgi:hypothetical protein
MLEFIVQKAQEWIQNIRQSYSVDPIVFAGLLVGCAPFFYYSIFRLVKALAARSSGQITVWSSVFLGATVLPYVYVLLFGRNIPWYIYAAIGLLAAQGVYSLVKKLRGGGGGKGERKPPDLSRKLP